MPAKKARSKSSSGRRRRKYARPRLTKQGSLLGLAERITGGNISP